MAQIIDSYRFGEIKVNGKTFRKDIIIFPDRVQSNWRRAEGHSLGLADLSTVLETLPTALIIGQGAFGRMKVPEAVINQLEAMGIQVISKSTKEACERYNQLQGETEVVAALHLTC